MSQIIFPKLVLTCNFSECQTFQKFISNSKHWFQTSLSHWKYSMRNLGITLKFHFLLKLHYRWNWIFSNLFNKKRNVFKVSSSPHIWRKFLDVFETNIRSIKSIFDSELEKLLFKPKLLKQWNKIIFQFALIWDQTFEDALKRWFWKFQVNLKIQFRTTSIFQYSIQKF